VNSLAYRIVSAEGERRVGDASRDQRTREVVGDPLARLDEVEPVTLMLLYARGHGEAVGVKDDVLSRESDLVDQDVVGPLADFLAALEVVGLTVLIECHHHDGSTVLATQAGFADELLLALLQRDGVDDRLALDALEAGLDDLPL